MKCTLPLAESVAAAPITGTGAFFGGAGAASVVCCPGGAAATAALFGAGAAGAFVGVAAAAAAAFATLGLALGSTGLAGAAGLLSSKATNLPLAGLLEAFSGVAETA